MSEVDKLISDLNAFQTRSVARKKLLEIGSDKIGDYLISKISDPSLVDNAVWAIAGVFGEWKYQKSVSSLVELLSTRQSLLSDISRTLNIITGMDYGSDPEAWQHYLSGPSVFSNIRAAFNDEELISFTVTDGFCKIYLPTPHSRKHEVLIYEKGEALTVYTECGYIAKAQIPAVQELAASVNHSKLVCEDEDGRTKVTLTAEWSGKQVDFLVLKEQVKYFAAFADDLENQLTGEDNI